MTFSLTPTDQFQLLLGVLAMAAACFFIYAGHRRKAAVKANATAGRADATTLEQFHNFPAALQKAKELSAEFARDELIINWLLFAESSYKTAAGYYNRGESRWAQSPMANAFNGLQSVEGRVAELRSQQGDTRIVGGATETTTGEAGTVEQVENFPAALEKAQTLCADFMSDQEVADSIEWAEGCYMTACHYLRIGNVERAQRAIDGATRSLASISQRVATLQSKTLRI